jgi:hypothetical protein
MKDFCIFPFTAGFFISGATNFNFKLLLVHTFFSPRLVAQVDSLFALCVFLAALLSIYTTTHNNMYKTRLYEKDSHHKEWRKKVFPRSFRFSQAKGADRSVVDREKRP